MLAGLLQPDYTLQSSETPYPVLPEGGALIQVTGCGICGSDLDKVVNQKAQPGSVLGHELVGTIQALSETAETSFQVGDRIVSAHHVPCQKCHFCRNGSESMCRAFKTTNVYPGGFSQVVALSGGHMAHTAFKVPEDITDAEASCVEPLGCVLKAIRRGGTFENGTVAVVGLGFIGMMAAQVYQNRGDVVYGVDVDHKRLALTTGNRFANQVFHPVQDQAELTTALAKREQETGLNKVDLVFLTVLNDASVTFALSILRDGGTLVLFCSSNPNGTGAAVTLDPDMLYFREIQVVSSYSPSLVDLQAAADMIFHREVRVLPLVTHRVPLDRIQEGMDLYRSGEALKVFVEMPL